MLRKMKRLAALLLAALLLTSVGLADALPGEEPVVVEATPEDYADAPEPEAELAPEFEVEEAPAEGEVYPGADAAGEDTYAAEPGAAEEETYAAEAGDAPETDALPEEEVALDAADESVTEAEAEPEAEAVAAEDDLTAESPEAEDAEGDPETAESAPEDPEEPEIALEEALQDTSYLSTEIGLSEINSNYSDYDWLSIDSSEFPDKAFRRYLKENCDQNGNGRLGDDEISDVTGLNLSLENIRSLDGLENFWNLNWLNCSDNNISELYLYGNYYDNLCWIDCSWNNLSDYLFVRGHDNLEYFNCSGNSLSELHLELCPNLKTLYCSANQIEELFTDSETVYPELETLDCSDNYLTHLSLFDSPKIMQLNCKNNSLASLDYIHICSDLVSLNCANNHITHIDLDNKTKLQKLYCQNNSIDSLDVSGCAALTTLNCSGNSLEYLDVSNCPKLETLNCSGNNIQTLVLGNCPNLKTLICSKNALVDLDLRGCPALTKLCCSDCPLNELDLSNLSKLQHLECAGTTINSLDISYCKGLRGLVGGKYLQKSENSAHFKNGQYILKYGDKTKLQMNGVSVFLRHIQNTLTDAICINERIILDTVRKHHSNVVSIKNPNVSIATAKLSNGAVYIVPKAVGAVTITLTLKNKKALKYKLFISDGNQPALLSLNVSGVKTLYTYQVLQLRATLKPTGTSSPLTWTSTNTSVANVNTDGLIMPVAPGNATIKVSTANKKTASIKVQILSPNTPLSISLNTNSVVLYTCSQGRSKPLIANCNYADSSYVTEAPKLSWKSSNTKIVTVDRMGIITAKTPGTATIQVTTQNKKTASCKVTVRDPNKVRSVKISTTKKTLYYSLGYKTVQLSASPLYYRDDYVTKRSKITWKSSNTKVATVDKYGKVVAKSKGSTTITATAGGKKATCKVTVRGNKYTCPYKPGNYELRKYNGFVTLMVKSVELLGNGKVAVDAYCINGTDERVVGIKNAIIYLYLYREWTTKDDEDDCEFLTIINNKKAPQISANVKPHSIGTVRFTLPEYQPSKKKTLLSKFNKFDVGEDCEFSYSGTAIMNNRYGSYNLYLTETW